MFYILFSKEHSRRQLHSPRQKRWQYSFPVWRKRSERGTLAVIKYCQTSIGFLFRLNSCWTSWKKSTGTGWSRIFSVLDNIKKENNVAGYSQRLQSLPSGIAVSINRRCANTAMSRISIFAVTRMISQQQPNLTNKWCIIPLSIEAAFTTTQLETWTKMPSDLICCTVCHYLKQSSYSYILSFAINADTIKSFHCSICVVLKFNVWIQHRCIEIAQ